MPLVLLIFCKIFVGPCRKRYCYSSGERLIEKFKPKSLKACKTTPSDSTKTQKSVYRTPRSEPGPKGAQHWEMDGLEKGEKCTQIQGPENKVTTGTKASGHSGVAGAVSSSQLTRMIHSSKEFGLYPEGKKEPMKCNFRTRDLLSTKNIQNCCAEHVERI